MLKGKNIILRQFRSEEDCYEYIKNYSNLEERSIYDHMELVSVQKILKSYRDNGYWSSKSGVLLIEDFNENIIGSINFIQISEFEVELGYRIFKKENRGCGYGTETLTLFMNYLFQSKPINRITLKIAEKNIPSQKLAKKCGFVYEGRFREAYFYKGNLCDFLIFGILRKEVINLHENV